MTRGAESVSVCQSSPASISLQPYRMLLGIVGRVLVCLDSSSQPVSYSIELLDSTTYGADNGVIFQLLLKPSSDIWQMMYTPHRQHRAEYKSQHKSTPRRATCAIQNWT